MIIKVLCLQQLQCGLSNLLALDSSSDVIKDKTFKFLTNENLDFNDYSGHLSLANLYLLICYNEKDKEQTKYHTILEIVKKQVEISRYNNSLNTIKGVYDTLYQCTENVKYKDASAEIKIKLMQNLFEDKTRVSAFDFFCNLCNIWGTYITCYDKISLEKYYEISKQDIPSKKKFLAKYTKAPDVSIHKKELDLINSEFLLINSILDSLQDYDSNIVYEFQNLIEQCEQSAKEKMSHLIHLIIVTNEDYTGHILKLQEQWERQLIVEDEDDE